MNTSFLLVFGLPVILFSPSLFCISFLQVQFDPQLFLSCYFFLFSYFTSFRAAMSNSKSLVSQKHEDHRLGEPQSLILKKTNY